MNIYIYIYNIYIYIYIASPGQAVYFTFSRGVQNPFQHLSKELISLLVTVFTKISILDA